MKLMEKKTNVRESFQKHFSELRAESGLSQAKLGKELGLSAATIGYYENGDRLPDIEIAARIATYFHASVDYLLGLSECKSAEPDVKVACKVTGLSEKAIENINTAFSGLPPKLSDFLILNLCLLHGANLNEEERNTVYRLCELWKPDSVAKIIINDFFESEEFISTLVNITFAVISHEESNTKIKKTMEEYKLNYIDEFSERYKNIILKVNQNYKMLLLEIYEELSKFVNQYDGSWIKKEMQNKQEDSNHDETDSKPE